MQARIPLIVSLLCVPAFLVVAVQAQQETPEAPSVKLAQTTHTARVVEGTVVSTTRHTLVVRSGDGRYHLFIYEVLNVPRGAVKPGVRVRVDGSEPDADGTQEVEDIALLDANGNPVNTAPAAPAPGGTGKRAGKAATQEAALPPAMEKASKDIESEVRRWHVGGKIGFGFSPELFMFGPQAQFGPFFSDRLLFRPNVEFGFGELTAMYAVNAEAAYRFNSTFHGQKWTPYFGMGPAFIFLNQSASSGNISFSNFNYKTGFNVFVGGQKRKTFVEMKTSLWSGKAPVLRLFIGYNF